MPIINSILDVINNTPMLQLKKIVPAGSADVFAKLEFLNPGGSIKDRMANYVINDAEESGLLPPGGTIVENTSGNTGVGVALIAAVKDYKAIFTIPDKMSSEKINSLKAYGAKVVVTKTNVPADSPESYYETAKRIHKEIPGSFYLNQYHNKKNIEAHYKLIGPEIWKDMDGRIDYFVAGIGTGGTLSGAAKYLKEKDPNIKVIAVDPIGSVFYDYFKTGKAGKPEVYKVEGIGEDMIVDAMDFSVVDDMIQVSDKDSFLMARALTRKEGLYAGGSSGTAVWAALKVAKEAGPGKRIVVILPDSGTRYLSKIFNDEWMRDCGFLEERGALGLVKDILAKQKEHDLISASPDENVMIVIAKMKKNDISQLPVLDDDNLVGVINESDLLSKLISAKSSTSDSIEDAILVNYKSVTLDEPVAKVVEKFAERDSNAVFVLNDNKLIGILTKIDLIEHLAGEKN